MPTCRSNPWLVNVRPRNKRFGTGRCWAVMFAGWMGLAVSLPAGADLAPEDLPDMGNLAAMIGTSDPSQVEAEVYDGKGRISAGMPADDSKRGTTARYLADNFGGDDTDKQNRLYEGLNDARTSFEKTLEDAGFATDDLGVALTACFIMLWELDNRHELPLEGAATLGKTLVHSFQDTEPVYARFTDEEKAMARDLFIATPVALTAMVKGLESDGRQDEADSLRDQAGILFQEVFKLPSDLIVLSDAGQVDINPEAAKDWQASQGIKGRW